MNLALWIAAGLLAAVALIGGITKTFAPKKKLAEFPGGGWVGNVSAGFVKTLGILEILAAAGLILPAVTDIAPVLVPVTAVCWALLMIGAIVTHLRLNDPKTTVAANLIYLGLAVFIAWGRFGPESFTG
ncbi:DoxX family protein [Paenibacillaceae bacterium WGS1546]|uniref:DoxX family protein n=1 Tax=Cohnella sp. WGS1546 TaxID=3366810 RepID=UPI00372D201F